ncbi:MAG: hypothetical protein ABW134_02620 [Candidatus Thiodiazotropha endolucinida]
MNGNQHKYYRFRSHASAWELNSLLLYSIYPVHPLAVRVRLAATMIPIRTLRDDASGAASRTLH